MSGICFWSIMVFCGFGFILIWKWWPKPPAVEEWELLRKRILQIAEEDEITLAEWYALIPICRFADERYTNAVKKPVPGKSCEEILRHFISRRNRGEETLV